jgi:putative component of toxin-antitoxin plasmid stabilization module
MPSTKIIFFKEDDDSVPIMSWLDDIRPKRVKAKCLGLLKLLALMGYELKRPRSDTLRDGIRELRTEVGNVNYRLLYFFHGKDCVVVSHGITKEAEVPDNEIDKAIENRERYKQDPDKHSYFETEEYYEEST